MTTRPFRITLPLCCILCGLLTGCVERSSASESGLEVYRSRLKALETHDFFQTTRILDRNGRLLADIAPQGQRIWVKLDQIPLALQQAVIATEDRTFYENSGVDASAVARAVLQNAEAGGTVSGASTITMQLARLVAFDPADRQVQTLERKFREAHLAAEMAERFTKSQILEAYLNIAYFGHGAYGVEAAATIFFGKAASDMSLAEATLVAGLVQAPSALDPWLNLSGAKARHRIVLDRMVSEGFLTPAQADDVDAVPIELSRAGQAGDRKAGYFVDYVLGVLPDLVGRGILARGGITITTSLDLALNEKLAEIARERIEPLRAKNNVSDAAVVVVRPRTGEILAMVGGLDYDNPDDGQVNAATWPRQPGSAFKPITYAAALEAGWTPASVLWDVPVSYNAGTGVPYQPVNYDGQFHGAVRLRHALANSLNAAAVDLMATIGVRPVHALARELGLQLDPDPWQYGLSLTLGSAEVSLLDLTNAFAAFAAGGQKTPPAAILRIEPIEGDDPIYLHAPHRTRVVSADTAYLISNMLSDAAARRPAFPAGGPLETSHQTAVKTGTTNDFRDNLTVGYTPYVAIGVWAGNKSGQPMKDVLGITGAAPIWHDAMEYIFATPALQSELGGDRPSLQEFPVPGDIQRASVCELQSIGADGRCRSIEEVFAPDTWSGDLGHTFAAFSLRSSGTGRTTTCASETGSTPAGGRVLLKVDRDATVATQIATWVNRSGLRAAPPPCDG